MARHADLVNAIITAGTPAGGGVMMAGGAIAQASTTAWQAYNSSLASPSQPEAQQRMFVPFLTTEAALCINVAFMTLFVFATPGK